MAKEQEYYWERHEASGQIYLHTNYDSDRTFGDYREQREIFIPDKLINHIKEGIELGAESGSLTVNEDTQEPIMYRDQHQSMWYGSREKVNEH